MNTPAASDWPDQGDWDEFNREISDWDAIYDDTSGGRE